VSTIHGLAGKVGIGVADPSLTSASGVVAIAELVGRLGMVQALDEAIGAIKQRDRGLSAGGLLVAVAQTQMLGGDFWSSLDRRRADAAGQLLSVVPTPASTTAAGLAARFTDAQLLGIEDGITQIARRAMSMLAVKRQAVLRAIAQIPPAWRHNLLITIDGAGATHKLLAWIASLNREPDGDDPGMRVEYSVGWPVDKHTGRAIAGLPAHEWTPMLAADGAPGTPATLTDTSSPDTVGEVADLTSRLPHLQTWPSGHQVFARRVKPLRETTPKPLPGTEQLTLDLQSAVAGWRYEAFATNSPAAQPGEDPHEVAACLDGRHRAHARVEDHFRVGNDTGADRLPSQHFAVNAAWYRTQAIACDLIA